LKGKKHGRIEKRKEGNPVDLLCPQEGECGKKKVGGREQRFVRYGFSLNIKRRSGGQKGFSTNLIEKRGKEKKKFLVESVGEIRWTGLSPLLKGATKKRNEKRG